MLTKQSNNLNITKARNELAAILSIIPGLGHIYKGYFLLGLILFLGGILTLWVGLILGFATAGIGLLMPVAYVILLGYHAFYAEDHRKHHAGIF